MPRLDNSDPETIERFELDFDPNDPGNTNPVDVCMDCWEGKLERFGDAAHPPYDEQDPPYRCRQCGKPLTAEDD